MLLQLWQWIMQGNNGLPLLLTGLAIRFIIGRRRFNRRGWGGLQHFSSYGLALFITLIEWMINTVGLFLIAVGLLHLLIGK